MSRWVRVSGLALAAVAFGCTSPPEEEPVLDAWQRVTCESDGDCPTGTCLASGICGLACATNAGCPGFAPWTCENVGTERQCVCSPKGQDICNGQDDDCNGLVDDAVNACAAGSVCEAGECVCTEANMCGGKCVDLASDVAHCGGCGRECMPGSICDDGTCICTGVICNNACVDLDNDANNCGGCGKRCGTLGECVDGGCETIDREWARWRASGQRFESVDIWEDGVNTGRYDLRDVDTNLTWERDVEFAAEANLPWEQAHQRCELFRGQRALVGEPVSRRWRLPTRIELLSIVDYSKHGPAINDAFSGEHRNKAHFWSSTKNEDDESRTWAVDFTDGRAMSQPRTGKYLVRCVK